MTNFEKKIKRLSKKDWAELRSFWLSHIPEIESLGQEPVEALEQDERLRQGADLVGDTGERRFNPDVSPASQLFLESIFVVCKAVRVFCEAARQVENGLPTWSISTAHHSAMFALRGFLGLCGIAYLEIDNRFFLMDVRPAEPKGHRQRSSVYIVDTNEIQLVKVPQMRHREWWGIYQRILRTSAATFGCWRYPVDMELARGGTGVLSRHRNNLHYRLVWFYDDLLGDYVGKCRSALTRGAASARECTALSRAGKGPRPPPRMSPGPACPPQVPPSTAGTSGPPSPRCAAASSRRLRHFPT